MNIVEILKVTFLGIMQDITEWLLVSNTGYMVLVDEFLKLGVTPESMNLFLVSIRLGSILAVVVIYWERLIPSTFRGGIKLDKEKFSMRLKVLVVSVPVGVMGILFNDVFTALSYNYVMVAAMLILFGVFFVMIEDHNEDRTSPVTSVPQITHRTALQISVFQMVAAASPGMSRSGPTIVGALLIGISRITAIEFTFFLMVLAMFSGSLLKLLESGFSFMPGELMILLIGILVTHLVLVMVIKFLVEYIKEHDFKIFGRYWVVLGVIVLGYPFLAR